MAYAIIGGLTAGTVLTLTLLPALLRLLLGRDANGAAQEFQAARLCSGAA